MNTQSDPSLFPDLDPKQPRERYTRIDVDLDLDRLAMAPEHLWGSEPGDVIPEVRA